MKRRIALWTILFTTFLAVPRLLAQDGSNPQDPNGTSSVPPAPRAPARVQISETVMASQIVHRVTPAYPDDAKQAQVVGSVVLRIIIGKDGVVEKVAPISGPTVLTEPAAQAVLQWHYKPLLLNHQPTEVETDVTINYTTDGASKYEPPSPDRRPPLH